MTHYLSNDELHKYETKLRALVAELTRQARSVESGALESSGEVHSNRGDEAVEDAALVPALGILANAEQELSAAREALARIASNSFGVCSTCHRRIPRSRLDLIPFASNCADCARRLEDAAKQETSRKGGQRA